MINEVIRLVTSNQIKETEENKVLFGAYKYPTSMIEAWHGNNLKKRYGRRVQTKNDC